MIFIVNEEINKEAVHLAIRTTEKGVGKIVNLIGKFLQSRKAKKAKKAEPTRGKQSLKKLVGQGKGLTKVELEGEDGKTFQKLCKKYGVDYAIVKDKKSDPPVYTIFLKANDESSLKLVYEEYMKKKLKLDKGKKPSIIAALNRIKEKIKKTPKKEHNRRREHSR